MMNLKDFELLNGLRENVLHFLSIMKGKKKQGFYKYSLTGDIFSEERKWGLANTVFAVSIQKICNNLNNVPNQERQYMIDFILNFKRKDDFITDPLISKSYLNSLIRHLDIYGIKRFKTIIAETKQSITALNFLGSIIKPIPLIINIDLESLRNYLNNLNFSKPWGAASNFNKLIFFLLLYGNEYPEKKEIINEMIDYSLRWLDQFYNETDGVWYKGDNISLAEKINGAMKVITGLSYIDNFKSVKNPKKIIDLCLSAVNFSNACNMTNIIFVLNKLTKIEYNYRKKDIEAFCLKWLEISFKQYYPVYGGFSFFPGKASSNLFGSKITLGKNEPDIHGTLMIVWGISMISKLLSIDIGFQEPNFRVKS